MPTMITKIAIENFKGIRERVEIELKPITLMFGPNSAGKSTVLHALHFAREVFERHNLDPDQTISGGDFVNLGGFLSFVHDHDPDRRIRLALTLGDRKPIRREAFRPPTSPEGWRELQEEQARDSELWNAMDVAGGMDYINDYYRMEETLNVSASSLGIGEEATIEIEVAWNPHGFKPYVSAFAFHLNGQLVCEVTSDHDGRRVAITTLNANHPDIISFRSWDCLTQNDDYEGPPIEELLEDPDESVLSRCLRDAGHWFEKMTTDAEGSFAPILLKGQTDALPRNDAPLRMAFRDREDVLGADETEDARESFRLACGLSEAFSDLLIEPLALLRERLADLRYLGPLRETPPRHYDAPRFPDPSRWASGMGAWDLLQDGDDRLVDEVNEWLSDAERLDAGYELLTRRTKALDLSDPLYLKLVTGRAFDESEDARLALERVPTDSQLLIQPVESDLFLFPHDVGTGISQLVPVVAMCLSGEREFLCIEQPELHLHPRIAASLGDLFIEATTKQQYCLLETHSEHLVLRLLRRIRETSEGDLPKGHPGLKPSDVSIVYLENRDNATLAHHLGVDETGEFLDRWPNGFFPERAEELF